MMIPPRSELAALYEKAYLDGYSQYGDLNLDLRDYTSHIDAVLRNYLGVDSSAQSATSFFYKLHSNDLYLSVACARQGEIAWNCFSNNYRRYIHDVACFVSPSKVVAVELAESVLGHIFLPDSSGRPRIASYDGRSSLSAWLSVIIKRLAIKERQRKCNNTELLENVPDVADYRGLDGIEFALRANRYEALNKDLLISTAEVLTDRERLMLRLRYKEQLQVNQIARLFSINPSSVTRQLERSCEKLRKEVILRLTTKHGLSTAAIEECLEDMMKNPSYSILALVDTD